MRWIALVAFAMMFVWSGVAEAKVLVIDFTIGKEASSVWYKSPAGAPYGLPDQPVLTGSVTVDSSLDWFHNVTAINFVTGTRVLTLADIDSSYITPFFGQGEETHLAEFYVYLDPLTWLYPTVITSVAGGYNYAQVSDGQKWVFCNYCVSIPAVDLPEPKSWVMMLVGFAGLGAAMRSQRKHSFVA